MHMNGSTPRTALLACAALAAPLFVPGVAAAESVPVLYLCQAQRDGELLQYESPRTWEANAPEEAVGGEPFDLSFEPGEFTFDPEYQHEVRDVMVSVLVPAEAEVVDVELSGGSGLEGSEQTVEVDEGRIALTAGGPFDGGESFEMPTVTATVTAEDTGVLTTSVPGTGFDDPGLELWSLDPDTQEFTPAQCYPDPEEPAELTTTDISS